MAAKLPVCEQISRLGQFSTDKLFVYMLRGFAWNWRREQKDSSVKFQLRKNVYKIDIAHVQTDP